MHCWQPIPCGSSDDAFPKGEREVIAQHHQGICAVARNGFKGMIEVTCGADLERQELQSERCGGRLGLLPLEPCSRLVGFPYHGYSGELRNHLLQELHPFGTQLGSQRNQASDISSRPRKGRYDTAPRRNDHNSGCWVRVGWRPTHSARDRAVGRTERRALWPAPPAPFR
jgi:hypothetical protein